MRIPRGQIETRPEETRTPRRRSNPQARPAVRHRSWEGGRLDLSNKSLLGSISSSVASLAPPLSPSSTASSRSTSPGTPSTARRRWSSASTDVYGNGESPADLFIRTFWTCKPANPRLLLYAW